MKRDDPVLLALVQTLSILDERVTRLELELAERIRGEVDAALVDVLAIRDEVPEPLEATA